MATTTTPLTLEEFRSRYAGESGYEYWFGEVVSKTMPTWLHAMLQVLLAEVLREAGYAAGSELELRVDSSWEPKPDVAASLKIEQPYPTHPVDIVAEILSPDDTMDRVFEKCSNYARIGVQQIFVFNPKSQVVWEWSRKSENLERIPSLRLGNGKVIQAESIWDELTERVRRNS